LDAKTGKPYWTFDMFAASWASPLIVEDRVYISDDEGEISIFKLSKEMEKIGSMDMESAVFTTPVAANDTLFIANRNRIFAIAEGAQSSQEGGQ
jgi:hypothetical protein